MPFSKSTVPHATPDYHRLVAENVSDIICVHDSDGVFEYVSPSVTGILGYNPEEMIGKSVYEFIHPEDAVREVRGRHDRLLQLKELTRLRCRVRDYRDRWVWMEVSSEYTEKPDGSIDKIITSNRDITRRMELEGKLRHYEIVVESASESILITDREERIIHVNSEFERLTGYTIREVIGKVPGEFLQGELSDPTVVAEMQRVVKNLETGRFDIVNYTKEGKPFWVRLLIQPFFDAYGVHEGFFSIQQDISEQKARSQELARLNRELQHQNTKLEALNRDLQEFSYAVSHDLKEPVNNVSSLMALLRESAGERLDPEEREFVEMARAAADRMRSMIGSLLEYARTGQPAEPVSDLSIRELVESVCRDFNSLVRKTGATVHFEGADISIRVYPTSLARLLQNLVSNSLKYRSKQPPVIRIRLEDANEHWRLTVADNGIGIPEDYRKDAFKLFNRRGSVEESDGIGLALCQRIARLHHGEIEITGADGGGTSVITTISKNLKPDEGHDHDS